MVPQASNVLKQFSTQYACRMLDEGGCARLMNGRQENGLICDSKSNFAIDMARCIVQCLETIFHRGNVGCRRWLCSSHECEAREWLVAPK